MLPNVMRMTMYYEKYATGCLVRKLVKLEGVARVRSGSVSSKTDFTHAVHM